MSYKIQRATEAMNRIREQHRLLKAGQRSSLAVRTGSAWIYCDDQKPTGRFLWTDGRKVDIGYLVTVFGRGKDEDEWPYMAKSNGDRLYPDRVTWWMPLPTPPNAEISNERHK